VSDKVYVNAVRSLRTLPNKPYSACPEAEQTSQHRSRLSATRRAL
jgi:hypothetical protein